MSAPTLAPFPPSSESHSVIAEHAVKQGATQVTLASVGQNHHNGLSGVLWALGDLGRGGHGSATANPTEEPFLAGPTHGRQQSHRRL